MRAVNELAIGVLSAIAAYVIVRHVFQPAAAPSKLPPTMEFEATRSTTRTRQVATQTVSRQQELRSASAPSLGTLVEAHSLNVLRQQVYGATMETMHARGMDVAGCLSGIELAGPLKLKLAARVSASPASATAQGWRLVEIIDGQALPDSFAACIAGALGREIAVATRPGESFPIFEGELTYVYNVAGPGE